MKHVLIVALLLTGLLHIPNAQANLSGSFSVDDANAATASNPSTTPSSASGHLDNGASFTYDPSSSTIEITNPGENSVAQTIFVEPHESYQQALSDEGYGETSLIRQNIDTYLEKIKSTEFNIGNFASPAVGNFAAREINLDPSSSSENSLLNRIINFIARTIGTFAILAMVVGGFFLLTSNGDQNQITKGKSIFIYSCLGLAATFLSVTILKLVVSFII